MVNTSDNRGRREGEGDVFRGLFDSSEISSKKEPVDRLGLLRMRSFSRSQKRSSNYASTEIMIRSLTLRDQEQILDLELAMSIDRAKPGDQGSPSSSAADLLWDLGQALPLSRPLFLHL